MTERTSDSVRGKSGKRIALPVGAPLKAALDGAPRKATKILVNERRGHSWTEDGFRTSWNKAFAKTALGDLHFHDLRGTAVTRLALAGCTVPEIASITGHSLKNVETLLDAHYLGGRFELAETAMLKMAGKYETGTEAEGHPVGADPDLHI